MNSSIKSFAQAFLPASLQGPVAYWTHRFLRDATVFRGNYCDWKSAAATVQGYSHDGVLQKTRSAMLRIKEDPEAFERDSCLLNRPDYPIPALAFLLWKALQENRRLRVVDFGGSLGSTFYQLRPFLSAVDEIRWAVVEQPHFVDCGRREFARDGLTFHYTLQDAVDEVGTDLLFVSGVLQYLPQPYSMIESMIEFGFDHMLLDRTALVEESCDRLTVQYNPPSVQSASYPAWFLAAKKFEGAFASKYRTVASFNGHDKALICGSRPLYRGYFLARR